jgi:cytochrome c oxidase accessory protein FixG
MSKIIATSRTSAQPDPGLQSILTWFKAAPASHRVRLIAGRFTNLRRLSSWPLLALCFITPWLTWNELPLVHLDLVTKQFRFGSIIFWPEDLMVLTWAMMAGAFALFFVAMASGRLWCGFSCPQTIWTFLFIRLEEIIEGSRHKRLKMDRTPILFNRGSLNKTSLEKVLRKLFKHSAWLTLSLITGITFISYFYPLADMATDFIASDFFANEKFTNEMSGSGLFWIIFIAGFTYLNAGFLREQVCIHMCPYSRFQSVMADRSTLTVQYDEQRNDCIDCEVCVQVCPTDIDIREGMQLACIACGACVDGCDDIMEKINKPKGLISFRPAETSFQQALNVIKRPRLLGYAMAFLFSIFLLLNQWNSREDVNASLERDRNTLYRINLNDQVENNYSLKLHNKTNQSLTLELLLKNNKGNAFSISRKHFNIIPGQRQQFAFTITLAELNKLSTNKKDIIIEIISLADQQILGTIETSFIAPRQL